MDNFKLSGKKVNRSTFSLVINDKPYLIEKNTEKEIEEFTQLIKSAVQGDRDSQTKLLQETIRDEEEKQTIALKVTGNPTEEVKRVKEKKDTLTSTFNKERESRKITTYSEEQLELLKKQGLESKEGRWYLHPFKGELPEVFALKIGETILKNKSIEHLKKFWGEVLFNENPEARVGLFKYLKKQNLVITSQGYFVTFRRLNVVKRVDGSTEGTVKLNNTEFLLSHKELVKDRYSKVKSWRKSPRSEEVYYNYQKQELRFTPIKKHEENSKDSNLQFLGTLEDTYRALEVQTIEETGGKYSKDIYTDNYTKTMVIKLGDPVRMDRDKCNSNSHVECSFGLHVGTPSFVSQGSHFGSDIVMCIVNPRHVISVPYSDAHKMRVCEYFPVKTVTLNELRNFDLEEVDEFVDDYRTIENNRLIEAFEIENILTDEQREELRTGSMTTEGFEQLKQELEKAEEKYNSLVKSIETTTKDSVSRDIESEELFNILKSRFVSK